MKKLRLLLFSMFVFLAIGILNGCGEGNTDNNDEKKTTFTIGHVEPENGSYQKGLEKFKDLVEEESEGSMEVEIHGNGALGDGDEELVQKVSNGTIDMAPVASPGISSSVPEIGLLTIPYMFEDQDHWEKVMSGDVGDELKDIVEEKGDIKVLDWQIRGVRNYFGNKPVKSPEDLKGVKVRLLDDPAIFDVWKSWGANPTSVPASEQYQALQNKVMDAAEADFINIYTNKYYEVISDISLTEHNILTSVFTMNPSTFDKLSEDEQKIVEEAGIEASEYQWKIDKEQNEEDMKKLEEEGVEINEVNKEEFVNSVDDIRDEFIEDYGLEEIGNEILEQK